MTVQHHLDDATLVRYASGNLDEAFSIVVASHLAYCETCRQACRDAEIVGGELLEKIEEVEMQDNAVDDILDLIEHEDEYGETKQRSKQIETIKHSNVPKPLQRFIGTSLDQIPWRTVAPGVRKKVIELPSQTNSSLYLLRIADGMAVPEHGHGGNEITLVLAGAYRDDMGIFGPGDIEDLDEHIEHQPKVLPGEPCICLVATEAPTRFKGFFSRLLQPLVGI